MADLQSAGSPAAEEPATARESFRSCTRKQTVSLVTIPARQGELCGSREGLGLVDRVEWVAFSATCFRFLEDYDLPQIQPTLMD